MNHTELTVKCLLGTQEQADSFLTKLQNYETDKTRMIPERQLNHYFVWGQMINIYHKYSPLISMKEAESLYHICIHSSHHSVRTRSILPWDRTFLVIKSSSNQKSNHTWVTKTIRKCQLPNITLEELDHWLLDIGREYIPRHTRIRTRYYADNIAVCLDQHPWYGHIAEFMTTLQTWEDATQAEQRIQIFMNEFGIHLLSQSKIEELFAQYNSHQTEYYGISHSFDITDQEHVICYGFEE